MNSKIVKLLKVHSQIRKAIDTIQKDRSYIKIHTIADQEMITLLGKLKEVFSSEKLALAIKALSSSVDIGNGDQVWTSLGIEEYLSDLQTVLESSIAATVEGGFAQGVAVLASHKIIGTVDSWGTISTTINGKDVELNYGFNMRNPLAIQYAKVESAKLIKDISEETRQAIRNVLSNAFQFGGSPKEQTTLLRGIIGLTSRDQKILTQYREALTAHGLDSEEVQKLVQEMYDKKLTARCETIARTETINAANEGQRLAWIQAKKDGLLTDSWIREWVVTPDDRLCPTCSAMEGQTTSIEGKFTSANDGSKIDGPTLHSRCRCTTKLIEKL